jgi:HEAT repeat protein
MADLAETGQGQGMKMTEASCVRIVVAAALAAAGWAMGGCNGAGQPEVDLYRAETDAKWQLRHAADARDPHVQTNAIEALAATQIDGTGALLAEALRSDRLPVVAAAATAIGQTRLKVGRERLLLLVEDEDTPAKLLPSLIFALHMTGDERFTHRLGSLVRHTDKWVRAEAVRVMGMMGEPSAIGPLRTLLMDEREAVVKLQLAEALAALGDRGAVQLLESYTKSQPLEDKIIAANALGRVGSRRSARVLEGLLRDSRQDPLVRMSAAAALGEMGDTRGYGMALHAAREPRKILERIRGKDATVRPEEVVMLQTRAVQALGEMGKPGALDVLHPLLDSEAGSVRVAAAQSILELLADREIVAPPPPDRQPEEPVSEPVLPDRPDEDSLPSPSTAPAGGAGMHTSGAKD